MIGPYVVIRTLGQGTTCKVKLAHHQTTKQMVAIKIINKESFADKPSFEKKVYREVSLMRMLDHPHILKLIDVLEGSHHLHLILEYAENGELFDYLVRSRSLREDVAIDIFRQLIYGLDYLHTHSVCHRDLKPENLLLDSHGRIKIADFGFARWMRARIAETSCGSPHYAAPEVIRGLPYQGCPADIWSAGVILFALLAGYLPFDDPSIRALLHKVQRGRFKMPDFHPDLKDLIGRMLTLDPELRITMEEIKEHPAFRFTLPPQYVVPTPIAYVNATAPIDLAVVTEDMRVNLMRIGIEQDEVIAALSDNESNTIKVFVLMMCRSIDIDGLPWDLAVSAMASGEDEVGSDIGFGTRTISQENLRDIQRQEIPCTPEGYSLAGKPTWFPSGLHQAVEFETEEEYGPVSVPIPQVMTLLEEVLIDSGYSFFHPSDHQLLARGDTGSYAQVNVHFVQSDEIVIKLQLRHVTADLQEAVCSGIRSRLAQLVGGGNDM